MSLSTTPALKAMLSAQLGPDKSPLYFSALSDFFSAKISQVEYFDIMRSLFPPIIDPDTPTADVNGTPAPVALKEALNNSSLQPFLVQNYVPLNEQAVQIHNALIISLFDATTHHRRQNPFTTLQMAVPNLSLPPSGENGTSAARPAKRRRVLFPPQSAKDGGQEISLRSKRFKRWALGMGKKERERIKVLAVESGDIPDAEAYAAIRRKRDADEVSRERGVMLLNERADPPGFRVPVQLSTVTRAPSNIQAVSDRVGLICAQHGMVPPQRRVAELLILALEAKLKQLVSHAISLTASSRSINSISTAPIGGPFAVGVAREKQEVLTLSSFTTLFTITPSSLPTGSAAAYKLLACGDGDNADDDGIETNSMLKERLVSDPRWQLMALLAERSTVREALAVHTQ